MPGTHHRALFLVSARGPFQVGDQATYKPGPGELLVRVEAAALNPIEWKLQVYGSMGPIPAGYPAILGSDIAGVVEQVGNGVSGFSSGDRVFYKGAWSNENAAFQQYNLATAEFVTKEAASLPTGIAEAVAGLYAAKPHGAGFTIPLGSTLRGKPVEKPLLILGGAGSVGQAVVQFGRLSGFSPIIATASLKNEEYLKSLGATHVLDRNLSTAALAAEIAKITSASLEVVFDAVSLKETQQTGYDLLAEGGFLALVLPEEYKPVEGRNVTSAFVHGHLTTPVTRELGLALHAHLTELLAKGLIKPNRVEVLVGGLHGVMGGLERIKSGQVSGTKLIVRPQETA